MDHETLISRIEIAAELGVQSQTIAHWERAGWFPRPKMKLSLKRIYYDRAEDDFDVIEEFPLKKRLKRKKPNPLALELTDEERAHLDARRSLPSMTFVAITSVNIAGVDCWV